MDWLWRATFEYHEALQYSLKNIHGRKKRTDRAKELCIALASSASCREQFGVQAPPDRPPYYADTSTRATYWYICDDEKKLLSMTHQSATQPVALMGRTRVNYNLGEAVKLNTAGRARSIYIRQGCTNIEETSKQFSGADTPLQDVPRSTGRNQTTRHDINRLIFAE